MPEISPVLTSIWSVLVISWEFLLLLAPFLLLGFLVAGLLHVFIPGKSVQRIMGGRGISSAAKSAAAGLALPVCSCGVVPVAIALRDKGASRPAISSFLITTPETGIDSVFVTWALLGPIVTVWRVIASFFSALLTAVFTIAFAGDEDPARKKHGAHKDHHGSEHEHGHSHADDLSDGIEPRVLWQSLKVWLTNGWVRLLHALPFSQWYRQRAVHEKYDAAPMLRETAGNVGFVNICRRIFLHAFRDVTDDVLPALVIGIALGGAIAALAPPNLADFGLGSGMVPYLVMFAIGIPIYMCSSASTPIGAALILKGVAPGAVLVFLLTGPATNIATIMMIRARFGNAFTVTYLAGIIIGAVVAGISLDLAIAVLGIEIVANLAIQDAGVPLWLMWVSTLFLLGIMVWRVRVGAFQRGMAETFTNVHQLLIRFAAANTKGGRIRDIFRFNSRVSYVAFGLLLILYATRGVYTVPPGHAGFTQVFGKVIARNLQPGLHYAPPWPLGQSSVWHVKQPRAIHVGLMSGAALDKTEIVDTGMAAIPIEGSETNVRGFANTVQKGEYLTGDGNLLQILMSVHYEITDPYSYFFLIEQPENQIAHLAEMAARSFTITRALDPILREDREKFSTDVKDLLQALVDQRHIHDAYKSGIVHAHSDKKDKKEHAGEALQAHQSKDSKSHDGEAKSHDDEDGVAAHKEDSAGEDSGPQALIGIRILAVNLIEIYPPPEAMAAFRDVTNAQEDRNTYINRAERVKAETIPRAKGNAAIEVARSKAKADTHFKYASARAQRWIEISRQVNAASNVLYDHLWYESNERALAGREKIILPPGARSGNLTFWRSRDGRKTPEKRHPHEETSP